MMSEGHILIKVKEMTTNIEYKKHIIDPTRKSITSTQSIQFKAPLKNIYSIQS